VGVVTKGVGFLPLLVLLPYGLMRARGFNGSPRFAGGARWGLVALGFLLGAAVWLVPMLVGVATRHDPALVAYRDEILFQQTVHRYAAAWHHVEPWYYFLVQVIPPLWLPFSLLLFWLVPAWKRAWRDRDAKVWLPLAWMLLTLLFFSLSTGKRGVYLFPALPGVLIAAAPFLPGLFARRSVQRVGLALAAVLIVGALAALAVDLSGNAKVRTALESAGVQSLAPIVSFAVVGLLLWVFAAWKRPVLAWPAVLGALAVVWSYALAPRMDGERSARSFMEQAQALVPAGTDFALMGYKEQFLLYLDRPAVNFGHARWREGAQESYDASAWLAAAPGRVLLIPESALQPCFIGTEHQLAGVSSGDRWLLVRGRPAEECVTRGAASRALPYAPPMLTKG
jgi:4-amino-4-deoxy-L-arabinose transferase-like glycosyltransferase